MPDQKIEIRDHRVPGWFWINNEVLDELGRRIGVYGVAVYCCLARYANNRSQECWPSIRTMASRLGTGTRQVLQTLGVLEVEGLIVIDRRNGRSNRYTLCAVKHTVLSGTTPPAEPLSLGPQPLSLGPQTVVPGTTEQDLLTRRKEQHQQDAVVGSSHTHKEDARSALEKIGVSRGAIRRIIAGFKPQRIIEVVTNAQLDAHIRNPAGWVINALDQGHLMPELESAREREKIFHQQRRLCMYYPPGSRPGCLREDPQRTAWPWCEGCHGKEGENGGQSEMQVGGAGVREGG